MVEECLQEQDNFRILCSSGRGEPWDNVGWRNYLTWLGFHRPLWLLHWIPDKGKGKNREACQVRELHEGNRAKGRSYPVMLALGVAGSCGDALVPLQGLQRAEWWGPQTVSLHRTTVSYLVEE